jgi:DNA repair protein RecN (Recombination protein N)
MLLGLKIENFAVIDEVEVSFGAGLTVLTGETGAGKSILVDALGLLLGGRADLEVVRAGANEAVVEGLFARTPLLAARLEALGLPDFGEEVSVRRTVGARGRGKAYVNGSLVGVGVLAQCLRGTVDIAGQHEHMSLFEPSAHLSLLDQQSGLDELVAQYRARYQALSEVRARRESLGGDERRLNERRELCRFHLEELDQHAFEAGEDVRLEERRRRLQSSDRLRRLSSEAEALLSHEEGAASFAAAKASALLFEGGRLDSRLAPLCDSVQLALESIQDAHRALSRYAEALEADPVQLQEVEDRLDVLKRLCRKHGTDLQGLLVRKESLAAELAQLESREETLAALAREEERVLAEVWETGARLHDARVRAASALGRAVTEGLSQLAMPRALFVAQVLPLEEPLPSGVDSVEFFFGANRGEPLRPLAKAASGGEASRVLLALKRALAETDPGACYVLDEADAGVSGGTAEVVGRMIRDVSRHRQVLCITHLPQVAAYADAHLLVRKGEKGGRTASRVVELDASESRTRELARMLSGVTVTREALGAAKALMRSASRGRGARAGRRRRDTGPLPARGMA